MAQAYEYDVRTVTLPCGTNYSGNAADGKPYLYRGVKLDANGNVVIAAAGEEAIGILYDKPGDHNSTPSAASVAYFGFAYGLLGATVRPGYPVAMDASGRFIEAGVGAARIGICIVGGGVGAYGTVFLTVKANASYVHNHDAAYSAIDHDHDAVYLKTAIKNLTIPVTLANLTDESKILNGFTPGFDGEILKAEFIVGTPASTAEKDATITLAIGAAPVTGGQIALSSAADPGSNVDTMGDVVAGTAITGANVFASDDTISVNVAATAAFSEGSGTLVLTLKETLPAA